METVRLQECRGRHSLKRGVIVRGQSHSHYRTLQGQSNAFRTHLIFDRSQVAGRAFAHSFDRSLHHLNYSQSLTMYSTLLSNSIRSYSNLVSTPSIIANRKSQLTVRVFDRFIRSLCDSTSNNLIFIPYRYYHFSFQFLPSESSLD